MQYQDFEQEDEQQTEEMMQLFMQQMSGPQSNSVLFAQEDPEGDIQRELTQEEVVMMLQEADQLMK